MKTYILALALVAAASASPAFSADRDDRPRITLQETAERKVTPDLLRAQFSIQATAGSAAQAQAQVNAAMGDAIAQAKARNIRAETGSYHTWSEPHPEAKRLGSTQPPLWKAQQQLLLSSKDAAAVTEIAGKLQERGLLLQQLAYHVSPELRESLQEELTRDALGKLLRRAEAAAAAVGHKVSAWARFDLAGGMGHPPPMPMRAYAGRADMATTMAAPVAEPAEQVLSLSVSGEAILSAR